MVTQLIFLLIALSMAEENITTTEECCSTSTGNSTLSVEIKPTIKLFSKAATLGISSFILLNSILTSLLT